MLAGLLVLPLMSGCESNLHMTVPQGLANRADVLAVSNRSQFLPDSGFVLGEYTVSDADRDWTSTTTEDVGPISKEVSTGGYAYTLSNGAQVVKGTCSTGKIAKHVDLGSGWEVGSEQRGLTCTCGNQAKLVISTDDLDSFGGSAKDNLDVTYEENGKSASPMLIGETYKGRVFIGDDKFDVTAIHEVEGGINLPKPSGYRVSNGKDLVGMVEVLPPGKMWLAKAALYP